MKQNTNGEMIFSEEDLCDLMMQGRSLATLKRVIVERREDLESLIRVVEDPECLIGWTFNGQDDTSVPDWDTVQQRNWYMPSEYKELDIAAHILNLCHSDAELQRVGEELLLYQERNLFDLLRYLHYLVDVLKENNVIWGVGRGSSVASYVLYLLGVHRINSMFYDLDPHEFLR
jgi:hypothetical protein